MPAVVVVVVVHWLFVVRCPDEEKQHQVACSVISGSSGSIVAFGPQQQVRTLSAWCLVLCSLILYYCTVWFYSKYNANSIIVLGRMHIPRKLWILHSSNASHLLWRAIITSSVFLDLKSHIFWFKMYAGCIHCIHCFQTHFLAFWPSDLTLDFLPFRHSKRCLRNWNILSRSASSPWFILACLKSDRNLCQKGVSILPRRAKLLICCLRIRHDHCRWLETENMECISRPFSDCSHTASLFFAFPLFVVVRWPACRNFTYRTLLLLQCYCFRVGVLVQSCWIGNTGDLKGTRICVHFGVSISLHVFSLLIVCFPTIVRSHVITEVHIELRDQARLELPFRHGFIRFVQIAGLCPILYHFWFIFHVLFEFRCSQAQESTSIVIHG